MNKRRFFYETQTYITVFPRTIELYPEKGKQIHSLKLSIFIIHYNITFTYATHHLARRSRMVELYFHSPICFRVIVIKYRDNYLLHWALWPVNLRTSLELWIYGQWVALLGRGISPVARPLPTQDNTNRDTTRTDIHASSGIRTHCPSVRVGEDISCLILRGPCDRQVQGQI
jgi:hypothetical protein